MRRRAAIVFIPEVFYYLSNIVRMLPAKVLYEKLFFKLIGHDVCAGATFNHRLL